MHASYGHGGSISRRWARASRSGRRASPGLAGASPRRPRRSRSDARDGSISWPRWGGCSGSSTGRPRGEPPRRDAPCPPRAPALRRSRRRDRGRNPGGPELARETVHIRPHLGIDARPVGVQGVAVRLSQDVAEGLQVLGPGPLLRGPGPPRRRAASGPRHEAGRRTARRSGRG